jgi:hypothetical protein
LGPAFLSGDGAIRLRLSGLDGQRVRVQRSLNLLDWEDWQPMTLSGTASEFLDNTTTNEHRFYRAIEVSDQ